MSDQPEGNLWISSAGEIAHPGSPRGGGGAGGFRSARPLGTDDPSGLPHPQSPKARSLLHEEIVDAAQGTYSAPKPDYPVKFSEFNIEKGKYVDAIKSVILGVHPPNNFLVNAVELIFAVDSSLAKKRHFAHYRCRQNVSSQDLWEKQLKDGKLTPWNKTMTEGESPDDPADGLQAIIPPIIAFHDAPGFMAAPSTAQLKGPQGKETDKLALAVFLRQNFVAWIDGRRSSKGAWERVSEEVQWHSNQSLLRLPFLNGGNWQTAADTEIKLGHTQGTPP